MRTEHTFDSLVMKEKNYGYDITFNIDNESVTMTLISEDLKEWLESYPASKTFTECYIEDFVDCYCDDHHFDWITFPIFNEELTCFALANITPTLLKHVKQMEYRND